MDPGQRRLLLWGLPAGVLLGGLLLAVLDPSVVRWLPDCPVRTLTGLDCLACGASRALHALLGGQVGQALDRNLLFVLLLPAGLYLALGAWLRALLGRTVLPRPRRLGPWLAVLGGLALLFLVLRNLPFPLGRYLAS